MRTLTCSHQQFFPIIVCQILYVHNFLALPLPSSAVFHSISFFAIHLFLSCPIIHCLVLEIGPFPLLHHTLFALYTIVTRLDGCYSILKLKNSGIWFIKMLMKRQGATYDFPLFLFQISSQHHGNSSF